jgi:hypothetical protein
MDAQTRVDDERIDEGDMADDEDVGEPVAAVLPIELLLNIVNRVGKRDALSVACVNRHWSSAAVLALWNTVDLSAFSNTKSGIRLSLLDRVKSSSAPTSPVKAAKKHAISSPTSSDTDGLDYGSIIRTLSARGCDVGSLKSVFSKCRAISTLHLSGATFRSFPRSFPDISASPFGSFAETLRYLDVSHAMLPGGRERQLFDILALHRDRLECLRLQFINIRTADIVVFFCGTQRDHDEEAAEDGKDVVSFPHLKEIFLGAHRAKFTPEEGQRLADKLGPKLKSLGLFGADRALMAPFFARAPDLTSLTLGANELRPLGRFAEAAKAIVSQMIGAFKAEQPDPTPEAKNGETVDPPPTLLDDPDVPAITHLHLGGGYWTLPFLQAVADRLAGTLKYLSAAHFTSVFREKAGLFYTRNPLDGIAAMAASLPNLVSLDIHVMKDLLPTGVQGVLALSAASKAKLRIARFKSAIEDGSDGFGELEDGIVSIQTEALAPIAEFVEFLELPSNFFDRPAGFLAALKPLGRLRSLLVRDLSKETSDLFLDIFEDGGEGSRLRGDVVLARKQVLNRFGAIAKERSAHFRGRESIVLLLKGIEEAVDSDDDEVVIVSTIKARSEPRNRM